MTQREYRANLDGLNIFFGAVLGFVLAGTERMPPLGFAILLTLTASLVVTILYISSSHQRLAYAIFAAAAIAVFPKMTGILLPGDIPAPANLQPTLAVWAAMTALVEFAPRERDDAPPTP